MGMVITHLPHLVLVVIPDLLDPMAREVKKENLVEMALVELLVFKVHLATFL